MKPANDFKELAISDGGPRVRVQVYQRLTGNVVWTQPVYMPYWLAVIRAEKILRDNGQETKEEK